MLPNRLCGVCSCLVLGDLIRKWAANLAQDQVCMLRSGLEVHMNILQQSGKGRPLMILRDVPA